MSPFAKWEPQLQNRFGNLLLQVLNTKFKGENLKELESWEGLIREYEGSTEDRIADNIRQATYQTGLPEGSDLQLSHPTLGALPVASGCATGIFNGCGQPDRSGWLN